MLMGSTLEVHFLGTFCEVDVNLLSLYLVFDCV